MRNLPLHAGVKKNATETPMQTTEMMSELLKALKINNEYDPEAYRMKAPAKGNAKVPCVSATFFIVNCIWMYL